MNVLVFVYLNANFQFITESTQEDFYSVDDVETWEDHTADPQEADTIPESIVRLFKIQEYVSTFHKTADMVEGSFFECVLYFTDPEDSNTVALQPDSAWSRLFKLMYYSANEYAVVREEIDDAGDNFTLDKCTKMDRLSAMKFVQEATEYGWRIYSSILASEKFAEVIELFPDELLQE